MGTEEFTNRRGYFYNILTTYSKIKQSEVRNIKKLRWKDEGKWKTINLTHGNEDIQKQFWWTKKKNMVGHGKPCAHPIFARGLNNKNRAIYDFSSRGRASFLLWNFGINFIALILWKIIPCLCSNPTTFEAASVVILTARSTACVWFG